jgi:formylglycine-generating enzyme required for sulfatase activity
LHDKANKYKKMKKIIQLLILATVLCSSIKLYAQDDYSFYLQVAEQCLNKNDCTRAKKNYELWKSMTGKTNQDLARRIRECKTGKKSQATRSSVFADYRETANNLNIDMVAVQSGTFTMGCTAEQGSDCFDNEKPAHQVTLSKFHIGKYPVTVAQFRRFIEATNYRTDAERYGSGYIWNGSAWEEKSDANWRNPYFWQTDNDPVVLVSWNDTQKFIEWLNQVSGRQYRLPTEAEWEFAARGGNKSAGYKYSGSNNIDNVAWYYKNSGKVTNAVGSKSPNELGIYDMSGNVWEWCNDWYDSSYYSSSSQTNHKGANSDSNRVLRGGCWASNLQGCRVSNRGNFTQGFRYSTYGFRLCLVP